MKRIKEVKITDCGIKEITRENAITYNGKSNALNCLCIAVVNFLIVYGVIGIITSAFEIKFGQPVVIAILIAISLYTSFLFYNKLVKNLGYILLFVVFLFTFMPMFRYVNSGFYGMVNAAYEKIEIILDLPGVQNFNESIDNRYISATVALIFLGVTSIIVVNLLVSNYMSIISTIIITLPVALIPVYFEIEPSSIYVFMLISGYLFIFIMKHSKHFKKKEKNKYFEEKAKSQQTVYSYYSEGKIMFQNYLLIGVMAAAFLFVLFIIYPGKKINTPDSWNKYKDYTDTYVGDFVQYGFRGLLGNNNTEGTDHGNVGSIGTVKPDFETDLIVTFTPYSSDTIYLKQFTGDTLINRTWQDSNLDNYISDEEIDEVAADSRLVPGDYMKKDYARFIFNLNDSYRTIEQETEYLKEAYEEAQNSVNSNYDYAVGRMLIEKVQYSQGIFTPYYSVQEQLMSYEEDTDDIPEEYTYYTYSDNVKDYLRKENIKVVYDEDLEMNEIIAQLYLSVPDENKSTLDEITKKYNIGGTREEIVAQIKDMYETDYYYTLSPGITPPNADYINYFLLNQKRGFCVHFATAAVYLLRYNGIPARYVEGYAIPFDTVVDGSQAEGENYDDWFEGYSSLGETAVVQVEVDDSHAHAWVEVYDDEFGWVPIEVTPSSSEDDEDEGSFWDRFGTAQQGNEIGADETFGMDFLDKIDFQNFVIVIYIIIAIIFLGIIIFILKKIIQKIKLINRTHTKNLNENLVNQYIYICDYERTLCKEFDMLKTHKEQLEYLKKKYSMEEIILEKMVEILERASYSNKEINKDVYDETFKKLRKLQKLIFKKAKLREKFKLIMQW